MLVLYQNSGKIGIVNNDYGKQGKKKMSKKKFYVYKNRELVGGVVWTDSDRKDLLARQEAGEDCAAYEEIGKRAAAKFGAPCLVYDVHLQLVADVVDDVVIRNC